MRWKDEDLVKVRLAAGHRVHTSKDGWVQFGTPEQTGSAVTIPIRLQATGFADLFPTLEGEIELAPMGDELTQVTLVGNYKPPIGTLGKVANKVLLHRVAEGSIKHFLDELAASIEGATVT